MRQGISITVDAAARARLAAIVADRNRPQKHVWRARIILLTADGVGTSGIERQTGKDKTCVWRRQERFMREGVDGLLRDKTRRPGKPPLATTVIERVVALTAMTGQGTSQARATLRSSPK
jgi:hypothetical protein